MSDSEFSASALLELEVDNRSLRAVRQQIQSEVGATPIGVTDGGTTGAQAAAGGNSSRARRRARREHRWARERTDYAEQQVAYLESIEDHLDGGGGIALQPGGGRGEGGGGGNDMNFVKNVTSAYGINELLKRFGPGAAAAGKVGVAGLAGGVTIDQVGKGFSDLTSEDFSNMLFGQAGGMVPQGFWDDQAGEGISISEATIAAGNLAVEGLADGLTDDGESPNKIVRDERGQAVDTPAQQRDQTGRQDATGSVPNYRGPTVWGWERRSTPNYTPDDSQPSRGGSGTRRRRDPGVTGGHVAGAPTGDRREDTRRGGGHIPGAPGGGPGGGTSSEGGASVTNDVSINLGGLDVEVVFDELDRLQDDVLGEVEGRVDDAVEDIRREMTRNLP